MKGVPYSMLGPEAQAAVRLAREEERRGLPTLAAASLRQATPKRSAHQAPGGEVKRSKNEQAYIDFASGHVLAIEFEPLRVILPGHRTTYLPDVWIRYAGPGLPRIDGADAPSWLPLDAVEVKPAKADGRPYWQEAGRIRAKLAAPILARLGIRLLVAWKPRRSAWLHEVVPVG